MEKPDVTLSITETIDVSKKEEKVKLLNTIKPSFLEWHRQHTDWKLFPSHYKSLAKFRLSGKLNFYILHYDYLNNTFMYYLNNHSINTHVLKIFIKT